MQLKWALIGVVVVMATFSRLLSSDFLYLWSWWRVGQIFGHVTEDRTIRMVTVSCQSVETLTTLVTYSSSSSSLTLAAARRLRLR